MIKISLSIPFSCHPFLHLRVFRMHFLIVPSYFRGNITYPHNQGYHLWSQLCVGPPKLSPYSLAFSVSSLLLVLFLLSARKYLLPLSQKPSCLCNLCLIQTEIFSPDHFYFLKDGHAAYAFTIKLVLNFSPSYSLTSRNSGFFTQEFHSLLYFLSAVLN